MKRLKRLSLILLLFLILLPISVEAVLDVMIEIKPSFVEGEMISFIYTITSTENVGIGYTVYVDCPKAVKPLLGYMTAYLEKDVPLIRSYDYIEVTEEIEPQTCTAYIEIHSPFEQRFERNFIIETPPSIVSRILSCKDLSCESESKILVKDSDIYLSYTSDIPEITTEAILIYPDTTIQQLTLPFSIKAEQIGTYNLKVTTSKEGYKTMTEEILFGVIVKEANIPITQICNANGICDENENYENCPQDCPPPCNGDFDQDGDVDGSDLAVFAVDFGRSDCCEQEAPPCEGNFDEDCDVDGSDLAKFSRDFGRSDCPIPQ